MQKVFEFTPVKEREVQAPQPEGVTHLSGTRTDFLLLERNKVCQSNSQIFFLKPSNEVKHKISSRRIRSNTGLVLIYRIGAWDSSIYG